MSARPVRQAIDCDVHCAPADLEALFPYLDEYWRHYVERTTVGLTGLAGAYPPGAATSGGGVPATYDELCERVLDPLDPRFAILNCLSPFGVHRSAYFSAAVASAVNDWLRGEWLARDPRLRASLCVSSIDVEAAVAEIERVGDEPGFVQVLLPVRTDAPYGAKRYHPLHAAAAERGLAIGIHAWGRPGAAPTPSGFATTYLEDYVSNSLVAQPHVMSFLAEGVFRLFPTLRVVFLECGFAWLSPLLWRFDKDWKSLWREVPWVERRPSEYVKGHLWSTIQPAPLPEAPAQLREQLDVIGTDWLLYASDHPHDHGDGAARMLDLLDDREAAEVLVSNAAEVYGLPLEQGAK